jgi:hypothetical protein
LTGTVDAPIGRHPRFDYKFAVMADGRHSITHYETLEAHRFASLLEVHLETGRTHQIRVHMAALKHPCVGDITYGADPTLSRRGRARASVAARDEAGFRAPEHRDYVEYESTYPDDLARALEVIEMSADASVRMATEADLPAVAEVYLVARDAAAMPPGDPPTGDECGPGGVADQSARECGVARNDERL